MNAGQLCRNPGEVEIRQGLCKLDKAIETPLSSGTTSAFNLLNSE